MSYNFDLSSENISMLKHLSGINRAIVFREGNDTIKIIDPDRNKFAEANFIIPPKTFGIFNLPQFVSILTTFDTGHVILDDESIRVNDQNGNVAKIQFADPEAIKCSPDRLVTIGNVLASFTIANETLTQLQSVGKILNCDLVKFFVDDATIYAEAYRTDQSDSFRIEICPAESADFEESSILLKDMNFLSSVYNVEIGSKKAIKFACPSITYVVAFQSETSY